MLQISIYLKKWADLESETQHAVITYANASVGKKEISICFEKKMWMMLHLSSTPLTLLNYQKR